MKLLSTAEAALGAMFLVLVDAHPCKVPEKLTCPSIIGPADVRVKAQTGDSLLLHCDAFTDPCDMTLIYWLVDGSFPEDARWEHRMVESEELSLEGGRILQRSLHLRNVTSEDFDATFTCVVTNSVGATRKHVALVDTSVDCFMERKRRCGGNQG